MAELAGPAEGAQLTVGDEAGKQAVVGVKAKVRTVGRKLEEYLVRTNTRTGFSMVDTSGKIAYPRTA